MFLRKIKNLLSIELATLWFGIPASVPWPD
jgi:hypothetical protein